MIASPGLARKTKHRLDELAAAGHIDENAPVRASSEILILAPIDKVWKLLSAIDDFQKTQTQSTISSYIDVSSHLHFRVPDHTGVDRAGS